MQKFMLMKRIVDNNNSKEEEKKEPRVYKFGFKIRLPEAIV